MFGMSDEEMEDLALRQKFDQLEIELDCARNWMIRAQDTEQQLKDRLKALENKFKVKEFDANDLRQYDARRLFTIPTQI